MNQVGDLKLKIEDMRHRLITLAVAKQFNFQDPEVLSLSSELDYLIAVFQKAMQVA
jgi:hypothetical protein